MTRSFFSCLEILIIPMGKRRAKAYVDVSGWTMRKTDNQAYCLITYCQGNIAAILSSSFYIGVAEVEEPCEDGFDDAFKCHPIGPAGSIPKVLVEETNVRIEQSCHGGGCSVGRYDPLNWVNSMLIFRCCLTSRG